MQEIYVYMLNVAYMAKAQVFTHTRNVAYKGITRAFNTSSACPKLRPTRHNAHVITMGPLGGVRF